MVSDIDRFPPKNTDPLPDPPPSDVPLTTPAGDPWPRPYYLEDGLRRVAPYNYTYNTFCKQRWRGRQLLDVFASEFRDRGLEYYRDAISGGRVVVNGKKVSTDYTLKNGEVISHTLHRHEPPVTARPIKVVKEDADMIVIDKPAGVPVHPAGRYRFNSITEIMRAEREFGFSPLPCNRLDRLTSGIMFVGKNAVAAEEISQKLRARTVRKEYIARVKGRFPDGDENGVTVCEENVVTISPILGLNRVRESGKSAKTLFKRLAYYPGRSQQQKHCSTEPDNQNPTTAIQKSLEACDVSNGTITDGDANPSAGLTSNTTAQIGQTALPWAEEGGYSIVHCLPLTGRTHQIRVHLQFLGHPISNDPIYSNRRVFGPLLGKNDSSSDNDTEIIARLSQMGKTESFSSALDSQKESSTTNSDHHSDPAVISRGEGANQTSELVAAYDALVSDYEKSRGEKMTGESCSECGTPLYSDPGPNELGIYLHAICYRDLEDAKPMDTQSDGNPRYDLDAFMAGGWSYTSPVPAWAWPVDETDDGKGPSRTGIRNHERWDDNWSVGLMGFDRETVVPNGGKMKGHQ